MRYFIIAMIAVGYAFWKLAIKPDLEDRERNKQGGRRELDNTGSHERGEP